MSPQLPSIEEATHYRLGHDFKERYYKIGEETVYRWDDEIQGWVFCMFSPNNARSLSGITEIRKPVVSPVVEKSDLCGRTGTIHNPTSWVSLAPEELVPVESPGNYLLKDEPVLSEEHGCTEEEEESAVEMTADGVHYGGSDVFNDLWERVNRYQEQQDIESNREPTDPNSKQVGGNHYKSMSLQPWAVTDAWSTTEQKIGYYLNSAIAYLGRYNSTGDGKGGLRDVQKAKHYLEKLESILEERDTPV